MFSDEIYPPYNRPPYQRSVDFERVDDIVRPMEYNIDRASMQVVELNPQQNGLQPRMRE